MIALVIALVSALIVYGQRRRVAELEAAVAALRLRIERLEGRAAVPSHVAATAAAPALQIAPESRPARQPQAVAVPAPLVQPQRQPTPPPVESLETRIGSRWLLYVGVCSILIGIAFFEKLALDRHWIGDTARLLQGTIAGLCFVAGGLRLARRGLRAYGHVLAGTGVAALYVSIYAAFNFYHLIARGAAFTMMSGVTLVAAALADAEDAPLLALFALAGGYLTPFLLADGRANGPALFGYDMVLVAGSMFMARRRGWPVLNAVSYGSTVLTVAAWLLVWFRPATYLTTELFLTVFCAMFLHARFESRQADDPLARAVGRVLASAPALYHVASLALLFNHPPAFLVYLVAFSIVGALVGARAGAPARVAAFAATAVPLLFWSATSRAQLWIDAGLVTWAATLAVNVVGLLEATLRDGATCSDFDVVHLHANGLVVYAGIYLLLFPGSPSSAAGAALGLALLAAVAAVGAGAERRDEALHFVALGLTLLSIALGVQLEGAWLTTAWAVEGAAVVFLALRENRRWLRVGGITLFAIAIARLLALQALPPGPNETVLLNARAMTGALTTALAYLLAKAHERFAPPAAGVFIVATNALALLVLTSEINAYWASDRANRLASPLAREMMLSVTWAGYAMFLIVAGLRRRYAPLRYFAMLLFAITIGKVFLVDLAELDQVYRVLSVVGLGAALLASSYVYQRFRTAGRDAA